MIELDPLQNLAVEVSIMARRAEGMFEAAVACIRNREDAVVSDVAALDREVDACELRIDRLCVALLAGEMANAADLRYVYTIVKTVMDLERIGDQSKTIARWSVQLRLPGRVGKLEELAACAGDALRLAVDALVHADAERARQVLQLEFEVDAMEDKIIESSTDLAEAFVAKALERVGDLATNIAENVIFHATGEDVRHGKFPSVG